MDKKHRHSAVVRLAAALTAASLAMAAATSLGDDYQFICTPGWNPVAASRANSSTSRSPGAAVASGNIRSLTEASALEARYRTIDETDPIALRTDKWMGTILYFR